MTSSHEDREGKVLSSALTDKVKAAHSAIADAHSALSDVLDAAGETDDDQVDEGSGDGSGDTPVPDPAVSQDGTGSRSFAPMRVFVEQPSPAARQLGLRGAEYR